MPSVDTPLNLADMPQDIIRKILRDKDVGLKAASLVSTFSKFQIRFKIQEYEVATR